MEELERMIITVKEYQILIVNKIPQSYLPSRINIQLIYFIVIWLNEMLDGKRISHN